MQAAQWRGMLLLFFCLLLWHSMVHRIFSRALTACALGALFLTSGCAYVQGWYGGGKASAASTPQSTLKSAVAATPLWAAQRHYAGDISAARAYIGTQLPPSQRMALIDVRDASEYRMGHPEGARHVPYPRLYQQCQPHPSGAPEAQIRSDDGSQCRYGVVPGSEVRVTPAQLWQAVQEALPYKDAPLAVLCRTGACAAEVANLLARPDLMVNPALTGQGYTAVYAIKEGFVGEPMPATDPASGQVLSSDKKASKFKGAQGARTLYAAPAVAWDANADGTIDQHDWSGWRNFLGLPYVVSMPGNLLSEAAQDYYAMP